MRTCKHRSYALRLTLASAFVIAGAFGIRGYCYSSPNIVNAQSVATIVHILSAGPNWTDLDNNNAALRAKVAERYSFIATFNTEEIKMAVDEYVKQYTTATGEYYTSRANVYALLRYVFNIPNNYIVNEKGFVLMENPMHGDTVDLLWPVKKESNGRLVLAGTWSGFVVGLDYKWASDFEMLNRCFGRRHIEM